MNERDKQIAHHLAVINAARTELKRRKDSDKEKHNRLKTEAFRNRIAEERTERLLTEKITRVHSHIPKHDDGEDHTPHYKNYAPLSRN